MSDLLGTAYPWIKVLHIVSVISWMAGIFYLPRLFVHHSERAPVGTETSETFKMMERKLYKVIMQPAMMATWGFGLILALTPGVVDWTGDLWFYVKLVTITAMTVFHVWLGRQMTAFGEDRNTLSGRTYRIMNEVPTVLMIVAVVMVVVKPF